MPQISKGMRQTLTTKIPVEQIPVLNSVQALTGEDRTAILARLVAEYLASDAVVTLLQQREESTLPISA